MRVPDLPSLHNNKRIIMFKISSGTPCRRIMAALVFLSVVSTSSALPVKDPLGSAALAANGARVIHISPATTAVNVERHETVRFVNPEGKSFTWNFYTLHHPTFDIRHIAPPGFAEHKTLIYVGPSAAESH